MKVLRIVKNGINYDVYITFVIDEEEYWGVVENITSLNPDLTSEVFKDFDLYQTKEWIIKIKGLIIKTIKTWLKPEPGMYKLINDPQTKEPVSIILRTTDMAFIPMHTDNADYQAYLKWVAEGNTPQPAE